MAARALSAGAHVRDHQVQLVSTGTDNKLKVVAFEPETARCFNWNCCIPRVVFVSLKHLCLRYKRPDSPSSECHASSARTQKAPAGAEEMLRFPSPQSVTGQAGELVSTGAWWLRLRMAPGRHSQALGSQPHHRLRASSVLGAACVWAWPPLPSIPRSSARRAAGGAAGASSCANRAGFLEGSKPNSKEAPADAWLSQEAPSTAAALLRPPCPWV